MIFCARDFQNKSTFHAPQLYDAKTTSFRTEQAKCYMCICTFPFACRSIYVTPMYLSSESFPSLVALLTNALLLGELFLCCKSFSSNNACNSTSSNFLAVLHVSCLQPRSLHIWNAETILHTYLAMEHVHYKLREIIIMIQQQFSSNENKKLMPSSNAPCSV